MPRRTRDPIVAVLAYFESAPIDAAEQGVNLAKEVVRRRRQASGGLPTPKTKTKARKALTPAGMDTLTAAASGTLLQG